MAGNSQKTRLKERFSITIDADLLKWLDDRVKNNTFASRSHGIEYAINELKKNNN